MLIQPNVQKYQSRAIRINRALHVWVKNQSKILQSQVFPLSVDEDRAHPSIYEDTKHPKPHIQVVHLLILQRPNHLIAAVWKYQYQAALVIDFLDHADQYKFALIYSQF